MGKTEKKYGVAHAYYFLVAESGHAARDDVPSAVRDKARAWKRGEAAGLSPTQASRTDAAAAE